MTCPLCGRRTARRDCPALQRKICSVCCATKRLIEIACPPDCGYLAAAREHPPAVVLRQQQRDVTMLMRLLRDFNQRQSELLLTVARALVRYEPPPLQTITDADILDAATALAATSETAGRGLIYEHRPASAAAAQLAHTIKAVLSEAGAFRDSPTERDLATALRRVESTITELRGERDATPTVFLEFLARIVTSADADRIRDASAPPHTRLIVS